MDSPPAPSSDWFVARYAELPLPPDPAALASMCSATLESLRDTEAEVVRLQSMLTVTRRTGIAVGFVMATEQVSEQQARRMLRNRGAGLGRPLRAMVERVITGHSTIDGCRPAPMAANAGQ